MISEFEKLGGRELGDWFFASDLRGNDGDRSAVVQIVCVLITTGAATL